MYIALSLRMQYEFQTLFGEFLHDIVLEEQSSVSFTISYVESKTTYTREGCIHGLFDDQRHAQPRSLRTQVYQRDARLHLREHRSVL